MRKILLLLVTFVTIGCESEIDMPVGNLLSGNISGIVNLYDTTYAVAASHLPYKINNKAGVTVSIEGTPFKTLSDSAGKWTFNDVPAGTYILLFEKEGFGRRKVYNVQHVGNGTLYLPELYLRQVPTVSIDLVLRQFEGDYANFTVSLSSGLSHYAAFHSLTAVAFLSRSSAIDPLNPESYDVSTVSSYEAPDSTGYTVLVDKRTLIDAGYKTGDKVFVRAILLLTDVIYVDDLGRFFLYGYYDYESREFVATGHSKHPTTVYNFTMP